MNDKALVGKKLAQNIVTIVLEKAGLLYLMSSLPGAHGLGGVGEDDDGRPEGQRHRVLESPTVSILSSNNENLRKKIKLDQFCVQNSQIILRNVGKTETSFNNTRHCYITLQNVPLSL